MLKQGTLALVTGGGGGIGSALVKLLASKGVRTIAADVSSDKLQRLAGIENVETLHLDVSDFDAVSAAVAGRQVDIVVNAAGVLGVTGTLYALPRNSGQKIMDVNVVGIHNVLSATVPGMVERNRGHIVNIGSIAGPYASAGQPMYSASKAAVHNMSMNLRLELFGSDVRVTEIRPGRVRSGMHAEMFDGDQSKAEEVLYEAFECLDAEDIADAIAYVLDTPPHVCVSQIEVVPTHQVIGGTKMLSRDQKA